MQINVIPGGGLDAVLVARWRELQSANPDLVSPFFAPEFTLAVAAVRDDVEVAVIEGGGRPVAFFPFQREGGSVGKSVGGILSDYHGLICALGFACDPRELVRKCRLPAWDFDHLLASQSCFRPFHHYTGPSPIMDLSKGYEAYAAKCHAVKAEQRKLRRIEKEVGPLRFVAHATESAMLNQTLAWKSQQYGETGVPDLFALPWVRALTERIHHAQGLEFAGMLSLLYAGNRLVAGHFGMRSATVWHWWFPSYAPEMGKYSPGLILLLKMAEHAPALGLRMIDLGKGMSLYKERLMNASIPLASGSVELSSWRACSRRIQRGARGLIGRSPLGGPLRKFVRQVFRQ